MYKEILIEVKDLVIKYGENSLEKKYNFKIRRGEILGVFGNNGIGKTALMDTIIGFIDPKEGEIKRYYSKAGYLSKERESFSPYKVEDVILLGRCDGTSMFYHPREEEYKEVEKIMKELNLLFLWNKIYADLSYGQQQIVNLARSLIANPEILYLDEPTNGMDFKYKNIWMNQILEFVRKENTVFMIHHNPMDLEDFANKVLLLYKNQYKYGKWDLINKETLSTLYNTSFGLKETIHMIYE